MLPATLRSKAWNKPISKGARQQDPSHVRQPLETLMTVMIALLRGVNVGGSALVSMADIRRVAAECGYGNVRTHLQSSNLVFTTPARSTAQVAETLRTAIAESTSVQPEVMVRTREELREIVAANPFLDRGAEPTQLHVVFMPGNRPALLGDIDLAPFAPEEAVAVGRELFMHLPGGIGRSKLAAALSRSQGLKGTQRNWRTVTKLVDMADGIA